MSLNIEELKTVITEREKLNLEWITIPLDDLKELIRQAERGGYASLIGRGIDVVRFSD